MTSQPKVQSEKGAGAANIAPSPDGGEQRQGSCLVNKVGGAPLRPPEVPPPDALLEFSGSKINPSDAQLQRMLDEDPAFAALYEFTGGCIFLEEFPAQRTSPKQNGGPV